VTASDKLLSPLQLGGRRRDTASRARAAPLTTNDAPGTARHLAALDRSGLESCNR